MKIFITGGTGNIGQYVTKALLEAGHTLMLLTRTPSRIPTLTELPGVTVVKGNILELKVMEKALQGCDAVIHIALGWGNDPVEMMEHDTKVTAFLADAAEKAGVKMFVYTSSTAAMGRKFLVGNDETAMRVPSDLYGATKAAAEVFLLGFQQYYSGQGKYSEPVALKRNVIRPGYVFSNPAFPGGASQSDVRFLNLAMDILQNKDVHVSPYAGSQFLSAAQIAQVYVKLVESDFNEEIFLALGTKFISWVDIAKIAVDLTPGYKGKIIIPEGEAKKEPFMYSVEKIKKVFGLSFEGDEDLREHVKWNLEWAGKKLAGENIPDPYHVW